MTEKDDFKSDERFWKKHNEARRLLDEVHYAILRENPKLNLKRRKDQNAIRELFQEKVKNDDRLLEAVATVVTGDLLLEQKTKH
jgi:hypothetical protein